MYGPRFLYAGAVIFPFHHRSARNLRLIAYAILALSLLLRPVLASMSEIHELAHDPTGSHLDVSAGTGSHHHDEASEAGEGPQGSALHTLLHFAHCCGQVSATAVAISFEATHLTPEVRLYGPPAASVPLARWQTPFRPPITA